MNSPLTRRLFMLSSAQLAAGASLSALIRPLYSDQGTTVTPPQAIPAPAAKPPPKPPALPPDKVQAIVTVAHRSLEKVQALVEESPLLVNSSWDWGGGDFETPLQAAAHTGGRAIAEYLLSKNARIDIYSAGMLGMLDYVKSALAIMPHIHQVPGPHGFTLLHCAKQGGEMAKPVYDWLLAQGVPEVAFRPLPFVWPEGTAPKVS